MSAAAPSRCSWGAYLLGGLGVLLIMATLINITIKQTEPVTVLAGKKRADERRKALAELRQANSEALNQYGWADQAKGIVRLPVDQAMALMVQEWQNSGQGRKKFLARIEVATAVAPKAPEKPSVYE